MPADDGRVGIAGGAAGGGDGAEAVVARARACVGTPFRLHGRVPGTGPGAGLDCVGLAVIAVGPVGDPGEAGGVGGAGGRGGLGTAGAERGAMRPARRPRPYVRRGWSEGMIGAAIAGAGLVPVAAPRAGDVALVMAGADAGHLMILTDDGRIEAHAGIGRVVEHPGWPPSASWWRAPG